MNKKTTKEFIKQVNEITNQNEFTVTGTYTNAKTKIEITHNTCGKSFLVIPNEFLKRPNCRLCGRRKTDAQFKQEVYDLVGDEFTFLEPYISSSTKIKVRHNICGNTFFVTPNAFLRRTPCGFCHGNRAKQKTTEQFKQEVYDLVGDEYSVIGAYINRTTNIKIKHNVCGRIYDVEPGNFLYGSRCIECYYTSLRLTTSEVNHRIRECLGESYKLVSDYVSSQKKSILYHKKCGTYFTVKLDDVFVKKSGCPKCVQSRGEDYVEDFLINHNIKYEPQKRFPDLKDTNPLSYDFYLYELGIVIEYQGEQHFRPKTFGGISKEKAQSNFELQQLHDKTKRDYASSHNLILVCPDYKLNSYSKVSKFLEQSLL